jgi:hypothetical protein
MAAVVVTKQVSARQNLLIVFDIFPVDGVKPVKLISKRLNQGRQHCLPIDGTLGLCIWICPAVHWLRTLVFIAPGLEAA